MSDLTVDDVDFLLKRDWFICVEDIDEMLCMIRDDVFWKVAIKIKNTPDELVM
jgi:hypothetical protein